MSDRIHVRQSNLLASWLVVLVTGAFVFGQALPQQQPPQNPTAVAPLRVTARLVEVNVIVQDKDGKPVTDLAKDDFTVLDEGVQQKISLFSAIAAPVSPPTPTGEITPPHLIFSNHFDGAQGGSPSVSVLLLDAVNTGFADMSFAVSRILKFSRQVTPEDQVALYLLTKSKLYILHDFTNDSATLVRVLGGGKNRGNSADPDVIDAKAANKRLKAALGDAIAETFRFGSSAAGNPGITSQALQMIAKRMATIPGRKSLVWVSSGFPISYGYATPIGRTGRVDRGNYTSVLSITAKALNNANVSVYPVDARGLIGEDIFGVISGENRTGLTGAAPDDRPFQTFHNIAEATGGRVFYSRNDLDAGIRRAIDDSRVSYALGYYPDHNTWDGKFRAITVKVNRPGISLRYRRGYFATDESAAASENQRESLMDAIHSPIQLFDLGLEARVQSVGAAADRQLKVDIRVSPDQMHFTPEGDRWIDSIEVVWVGISADGRIVEHGQHAFTVRPPQKSYDEITREGLPFSEHVSVNKESVEMRLVVRDVGSGATGSLNIPLSNLFGGAAN